MQGVGETGGGRGEKMLGVREIAEEEEGKEKEKEEEWKFRMGDAR